MSLINTLVFAFACVTLFLYGLQSFSREVQALSSGPLNKFLQYATTNRFIAALSGAFSTALLQSSSAVSALTVSLANSKVLSLKAAMAILIGANIGTASTAFLVSLKVQGIGAYFLILGALLSLLPIKIRVIGKSLFYFGFIFFALDEISKALAPFFNEPFVYEWLSHADIPLIGILVGMILTSLLQSSSVLTGIVVILTQQGLISLSGAVAVVLGANIGTTTTALIASLAMGRAAKAVAVANLIFNIIGVVFAFFFIDLLAAKSSELSHDSTGLAVAISHLIFNSFIAILFLAFLTPTYNWISKYIEKE